MSMSAVLSYVWIVAVLIAARAAWIEIRKNM